MKQLSSDIPVPLPEDWARIHHELSILHNHKSDPNIPKPPVPLILAGAAFSTAGAIRDRWWNLVDWANQYGFAEEMAKMIPSAPEYDVAERIAGISENSTQHWWEGLGDDEE